jgi:hypothetical protein
MFGGAPDAQILGSTLRHPRKPSVKTDDSITNCVTQLRKQRWEASSNSQRQSSHAHGNSHAHRTVALIENACAPR